MMGLQSVALVGIGLVACFMGYSMFRSMLPLWGFILGGWIFFTLMPGIFPAHANELIYQIGAFLLGGIIGALVATPLYFAMIFLSGGALGMMFGVMLGALFDVGGIGTVRQLNAFIDMSFPPIPHSFLQYALMFLLGAVLGVAALNFQRFMISASSAFLGAAALISGLSGSIVTMSQTAIGQGAITLVGWLILGFIGLFVQYQLTGDV